MLVSSWAFVSLLSVLASGALVRTGFTVILDDVWYYAPPAVVGEIGSTASFEAMFQSADDVVPITIMNVDDVLDATDVLSRVDRFESSDDVYTDGFSKAIHFRYSTEGAAVSGCPVPYSAARYSATSTLIPDGPYFLSSTGGIYQAYRLYSDDMGAFTESVYAAPGASFSVLPAGVPGQSLAIAVPSRLYYKATAEKPLAGVRIGIKDLYDITGLRTSNGNRAWYHLYPPAKSTATPVKRLIDAGAIIVGKMKTSQFANGETATSDWMDYHAPFNPRGDGYQDPSSSSSGPGAAIGAYEWLDLALGSDTGGSIRNPAQVQGIHGNRPSLGRVGLEHTMPLAPELDTAGFLARDPAIWTAAAKATYGDNITFTSSYPKKILAMGFPESVAAPGEDPLVDFLNSLTSFLGADTMDYDILADWNQTSGSNVSLFQLLDMTYLTLITKEQTRLVRDPFYRDYAAAHQGRRPFVDVVPQVRWDFADTTTETLEAAVANMTVFRDWISSHVLIPTPVTCSSSLLVYVSEEGLTNYRNVYRAVPRVPMGFGIGSISNLASVPDLVVPIGHAAYNSTVTLQAEYLPVAVDFVAARGCDGMLFSLINELYKEGLLTKPVAGRDNVSGGQYLYKRMLEESR